MDVEILIFLAQQGFFQQYDDEVSNFLRTNKYFDCSKCNKVDVCGKSNSDYYMVKDELWDKYNCDNRLLCWNCFEDNLGRPLAVEDFIDCNVNSENSRIQELTELEKCAGFIHANYPTNVQTIR